ncbi:MAG: sigma-54 dependent transcriptional regulator [Desulfosudaceae bacterium]
MTTILIIDDEQPICSLLSETILNEGWDEPVVANNLSDARQTATAQPVDIVLLDIHLPDGSGLENLPFFINSPGRPEVIILTGYGHSDAAGLALEYGAWDYIEKPVNIKNLALSIHRAIEFRQAKQAMKQSRILKRNGIIGSSPVINDCLEQMAEAAEGDHSVLVAGETGTGKELLARAIHLNSQRAAENFIVVDCTALSETLIESNLFGHVKGAFTDAGRDRDGLVKLAHRGTLFLDEIGELPPEMQKKFLRVLEEKKFRPVGSTAEVTSDFRLISATNRDLDEMVDQGSFRKDLLYRIKSQKLTLPPLRQRKEDLSELTNHYLARICRRLDIPPKTIQPEFMQCLHVYDWPGNIRELVNVLDQVVCSAKNTPVLFHKHLPIEIRSTVIRQQTSSPDKPRQTPGSGSAMGRNPDLTAWPDFRKAVLEETEKSYLKRLTAETNGDIDEMIRLSGLSKSRIYGLLSKHNLHRLN